LVNDGSSPDDIYLGRLWSCSSGQGFGGPNSVKNAILYANQYRDRKLLPGYLEIYGLAFQWFQYPGLEIIYFEP
jgi:hypothetical protein